MLAAARAVVARCGEPRLVHAEGSHARLLPEEEGGLVVRYEDGADGRRYGDTVTSRLYVLSAAALTAAGELEVLLGAGGGGGWLVSAIAVPAVAVPLAWSGRAPLPALAVIALALLVQAALGGHLVGEVVSTLVVLAVALYAAGRHAAGSWRLAGAAGLAMVLAATRVLFDPAAQRPRDALLTLAAVAGPLLVGRWTRGQTLLQRALAEKAARGARDRARDARHAAEEERARIAADLQVAVADALRTILGDAVTVRSRLRAGEHGGAREQLAGIAGAARMALADVRRVLGVLRHDGEAPRLAPPDPLAPIELRPDPPAAPATAGASRVIRRPPRVGAAGADRLLAAAVFVVAAIELVLVAPAGERAIAPVTAVAIAAPLLWRRRRPVAMTLAALAAIGLQSAILGLDAFPTANMIVMVCATFAIGAHAERSRALAGLLLVAAGAAAHAAVFYPDGVAAALLGGVALPWTVGRVVRGNRRLTLEGRQRNVEVERSRAQEARAAVTTERLRVARELHDAVAHNISVIAIQAGGADGIAERDPDRAEQCVELIETVAREAIAELARLTSLTAAGNAEADAPPSLARVDQLAQRARATGLEVEIDVDGAPPPRPAGVDLAAFRILQEALANTAKHAHADRAWVTVRYGRRAIELEVADDGRGPDDRRAGRGGGGHGLVGMRERVALYGGSLDLGRHASGGFLVRARLPLDA